MKSRDYSHWDGQKICTTCLLLLPLKRFHKKINGAQGVKSICKPCCRERDITYYRRNKSTILSKRAEWRADNKEVKAATDAKYNRTSKVRKAYKKRVQAAERQKTLGRRLLKQLAREETVT